MFNFPVKDGKSLKKAYREAVEDVVNDQKWADYGNKLIGFNIIGVSLNLVIWLPVMYGVYITYGVWVVVVLLLSLLIRIIVFNAIGITTLRFCWEWNQEYLQKAALKKALNGKKQY